MFNTSQLRTNGAPQQVGAAQSRSIRTTRMRRGLPIILAILGIPAAAQAGESSCSLTRAAGTWTFTDSGTVIGVGPRVALGKFTLNTAGELLNGMATSSLNGVIADETLSGSYTVNADCTATFSVEIYSAGTELFAITLNGIFDDRMQHLNAIFTSVVTPGGASLATVIALEGQRQ